MKFIIGGILLGGLFGGTGKGCSSITTSHNFKVGDCVVLEGTEPWEKDIYIKQIVRIGKRKYEIIYLTPEILKNQQDSLPFTRQNLYEKIECPKDK